MSKSVPIEPCLYVYIKTCIQCKRKTPTGKIFLSGYGLYALLCSLGALDPPRESWHGDLREQLLAVAAGVVLPDVIVHLFSELGRDAEA